MRYLFLTPPFVQTNTPYPATAHLVGFLKDCGLDVHQRDLSIKVARDVLMEYGGEEIDELLEFLSGEAPAEAKIEASKFIDEVALDIRDNVDPQFGFSRYAEKISASICDFRELEKLVKRRGVIDTPLERRLEEAIAEIQPDEIGVACPFPGTLVASFKVAAYVRKHHPSIKLSLGGGFVSTELRNMSDKRPYKYFDRFLLDEGYGYYTGKDVPVFVKPSYEGLDKSEYFDVVETANPMHSLWSTGKWIKLQMARGCYWHKCAFCDVHLPYIKCFEMPKAGEIVDAMQELMGNETCGKFHFVDEAMPPALVRQVAEEIIRRDINCQWWGNIRFDTSWTEDLAVLMAKSGCIAVTGGLECANDRLLALMNKGITLASARKALRSFKKCGIMVHAYLMYGFPTETAEEALGALDNVRKLFKYKLISSAFWHRFALTIHSPIYRNAKDFKLKILQPENGNRRIFSLNEISFREKGSPNWNKIGKVLNLATYNYLERHGLDKPIGFWCELCTKRRTRK